MARWLTYTRERFPLVQHLLLTGGLTASAFFLRALPDVDPFFHLANSPLPFLLSLIGLLVFFFQLRLMDELKDFKKDTVANPKRPLPRGLLTRTEVARMIQAIQVFMYMFAIGLIFIGFKFAGMAYALTSFWLFLMFKEFFVGDWLSERPLLYAISHQAVSVPLSAFSVFLFGPVLLPEWAEDNVDALSYTLLFGLAIVFGFFVYEVCRKLNPTAHPILGTYFVSFGFLRTGLLLTVLGALLLGVNAMLDSRLALSAAVLVLPLLLGYWTVMNSSLAAKRYKLLEMLAVFVLLHQLWSVTVVWFL